MKVCVHILFIFIFLSLLFCERTSYGMLCSARYEVGMGIMNVQPFTNLKHSSTAEFNGGNVYSRHFGDLSLNDYRLHLLCMSSDEFGRCLSTDSGLNTSIQIILTSFHVSAHIVARKSIYAISQQIKFKNRAFSVGTMKTSSIFKEFFSLLHSSLVP